MTAISGVSSQALHYAQQLKAQTTAKPVLPQTAPVAVPAVAKESGAEKQGSVGNNINTFA